MGGDAADPILILLGEPEVAVPPGGDAFRSAIGRGHQELGDDAAGGDAPDLVRARSSLGEPEVAIPPGGDAPRIATARGDRELGDPSRFCPGSAPEPSLSR